MAAAFLGFAAAAWRVSEVAAPVLTRTTIGPLIGTVEALDEREVGARLLIRVESFAGLAPEARPARVRVSFRKTPTPLPGDVVAATARLLPPPEAARPGGYDFARDAYFQGIGAVGSLVGAVTIRAPTEPLPLRLRLAATLDAARNGLTRRIAEAAGGQAGAVAAALVTGKRGLIGPATNDALRAAGIYHVVSISGLHMVLAAGVVFWLVRALLALVPHCALLWPIKKIAAGFAMVGVTAYCAFSGWDIAAERSLIMTLIMLGAILVDRPALSMRNLALAALIALAREPEGLLGPSFQMSFGAVAGLIACARLIDGRLFVRPGAGRLGRLVGSGLSAVTGTLATTLVAQVATAPFATYHFQTIQPFGLVGNALTLPLVSLVVMPSAVIGILAYPFALDRPIWWLMGQAVGHARRLPLDRRVRAGHRGRTGLRHRGAVPADRGPAARDVTGLPPALARRAADPARTRRRGPTRPLRPLCRSAGCGGRGAGAGRTARGPRQPVRLRPRTMAEGGRRRTGSRGTDRPIGQRPL